MEGDRLKDLQRYANQVLTTSKLDVKTALLFPHLPLESQNLWGSTVQPSRFKAKVGENGDKH
jgi:hypothetical protein